MPARRAESGELANVRLWLGADIQRESAERPLLTQTGHSVEYAVQQVARNTSDCRTPAETTQMGESSGAVGWPAER